MPIDITPTPTTTTVTVQQSLVCNAGWLNTLTIDGSSHDTTRVAVTGSLEPYAADADGTVIAFSGAPLKLTTRDVYTAAANMAKAGFGKFAAALGAIEPGVQDWAAYLDAQRATLVTVTATKATADAAVVAAQTTLNTANAARQAAYMAKTATPPTGTQDDYATADKAWADATAALQAAQATAATAASNVTIATAAVADAANPPLVLPTTTEAST